jgi:glucosylceramidase
MKRFLPLLLFSGFLQSLIAQNGPVTVYTTAENTGFRLTKTSDSSKFYQVGQPPETQVCIIVDPTHHFQTMLGIGGALTDASANICKLPVAVQKQVLTAYYDTVSGIGYTGQNEY